MSQARAANASRCAAFACVLLFVAATAAAIVAIVIPATEFFRKLPERIDRIQMNLAPLIDLYASLEKSVNRTVRHLAAAGPVKPAAPAAVTPHSSIPELLATPAPGVII